MIGYWNQIFNQKLYNLLKIMQNHVTKIAKLVKKCKDPVYKHI